MLASPPLLRGGPRYRIPSALPTLCVTCGECRDQAAIFLSEVLLNGTHFRTNLIDLFGDALQVRIVLLNQIETLVDLGEVLAQFPSVWSSRRSSATSALVVIRSLIKSSASRMSPVFLSIDYRYHGTRTKRESADEHPLLPDNRRNRHGKF
jgi:hypothetical protein